MRIPKNAQVRCPYKPDKVSIVTKKQRDRDLTLIMMADPTAPENIGSVHVGGIYLMKALMDEVLRVGGVDVYMRRAPAKLQPKITEELAE